MINLQTEKVLYSNVR